MTISLSIPHVVPVWWVLAGVIVGAVLGVIGILFILFNDSHLPTF